MMKSSSIVIKLTPKSHRNEIVGWEGDELKVRVRAVPEKGKANEALLSLLAESLDVPQSCLTLLSGATSRHKRVLIKGYSNEDIRKLFPG